MLKYFKTQELVPPDLYQERGDQAIESLDYRALIGLDIVRGLFGAPLIVNNWAEGGLYSESGLRLATTKVGGKWSQHKYGRAWDLKPTKGTPQELHAFLISKEIWPKISPYFTTLEDIAYTPTWVHIDSRYTFVDTKGQPYIVKP